MCNILLIFILVTFDMALPALDVEKKCIAIVIMV